MPQKCSICTHPKRTEIETAIASSTPSRRILAVRYKTSTGAIGRHARNCVTKAIATVRSARKEALADRDAVTVETVRNAVVAQARDGTLQTAQTIENELHRLIERMGKLFDACDEYLDDPDNPGQYTLAPRSDETRIVWEELEEEPAPGEKPKWVKKAGTLQQALELAFANGHRRFVSTTPVKKADTRELILTVAGQISRQIDIMARLEGRYNAPAPLSDGNTVQLVWIQQVLIQHGLLKS
jgi:hypothetical protein